jgi:3-hydroxymyristoyl/3-hydroxydecanoyl-(acyl carrier protein) dehydratase
LKFRLVDKIVQFSQNKSIETRKAISFEEFSLLKVWGRKGTFPETLILQFAVESLSWLVAMSTKFQKICVLEQLDEAAFLAQTAPGATLTAHVDMTDLTDSHCQCVFAIYDRQQKIAHGSFRGATMPLSKSYNPDDYALIWRELYAEASHA